MGNIHLVTGYAGEAHVTAADSASLNAAIIGPGEYVLNRGNKLAATIVTNNKIRIADGDILMQGRHIRLNEGNTVDLAIENGVSGYYRNDLIVARYTRDSSTGAEDCNLVVIKGTASSSKASDPAYTSGDIINDHVLITEMPLYRVPLNGLNVQNLVPLFEVVSASLLEAGADKQKVTDKLPTGGADLADGDFFPYYDVSLTVHRKTPWGNIVSKVRSSLFKSLNGVVKANGNGLLSAMTVETMPIEGSANLVTSGGVKEALDTKADKYNTLWENPDPTASFSAQTVTINGLGDCNEFLFEFATSTGEGANYVDVHAIIGESEKDSEKCYSAHYSYVNTSWGISMLQREFYINLSANTVRYKIGWAGGGVTGNKADNMIPVRIWGRKV